VTFDQFWPEYVRAHSKPSTRVIHCVGTLLGWMTLGAILVLHKWLWIPLALIIPYSLAWISHFFIEHNKPASFGHPFFSWWADQLMVFLMLTGQMGEEVRKYGSAAD